MHGQILQADIDGQAEDQSEDAEENAEQQQLVAVDAEEIDLREIGKLQIGFATTASGACATAATAVAAIIAAISAPTAKPAPARRRASGQTCADRRLSASVHVTRAALAAAK